MKTNTNIVGKEELIKSYEKQFNDYDKEFNKLLKELSWKIESLQIYLILKIPLFKEISLDQILFFFISNFGNDKSAIFLHKGLHLKNALVVMEQVTF